MKVFWLFRKFTKKSFKIAGAITGTYLVLAVILVAVVSARADSNPPALIYDFPQSQYDNSIIQDYYYEYHFEPIPHIIPEHIVEDEGNFLRPPGRTNFIFIGLDNNSLADAIMVGTFYRDTGDIRLMSIPRDMYTHIPQHRLEQMRADGLRPPSSLKINAVRAFGGRVHGVSYLKAQLGEMLGVQFHYYIEVDLAAFRRIVDAIGGVTMYIPRRLQYEDPYQNLFIDIPAGYQHLDGNMAEGVVRFRSFPTGDLMRNTMQMEFMSQLMKQVLTREAIMNDPLALAGILINDVRTNIGILELARYVPYIGRISADRINTFTLPGKALYRNGISWFIPNAEEVPGIVNQVFYANPEAEPEVQDAE